MKKFFFLIVASLFVTIHAEAQNTIQNKGIGGILGEPTGVSLAYWTSDSQAFSAGAAWYLRENASLHLHVDYLFHRFGIINVNRGSIPLYYGIGGRLRFTNEDQFGIRFPFGIAYHFEDDPLQIFLEIVPVLELIPGTDLAGNSGIGIRYYFR
ncbi:MAG: hypothetical protein WD097_05320 [Balneolales bacterium]